MFNQRLYENSRPDGFAVLEVVRQGKESVEEKGKPRLFVPLKRTELHGEVAGPLASLRLVQVFGYAKSQCPLVIEAAYRFPLPGDAAVTGVKVRFGDVEIEAALKERQQAEAEYQEAKKRGRQATLTTRESPDVFTLMVAGIMPDQDVVVETTYVQLARAQGAGWSLRAPLTTSPRYTRSDEEGSRHAEGQPLALLKDPGHRFSLDLLFRGASTVTSPTHALASEPADGGVNIHLKGGEILPDRDCVLAWQPVVDPARTSLTVLAHADQAGGHFYFVGLAAPPTGGKAPTSGREAILLVDHSGSMDGAKWQAADWAVKQFLLGLTDKDTFALGLFHNVTTWFSDKPQKATEKQVEKASAFLESHKDSGGTELGVALEQALSLDRGAGEKGRHVLMVTDAEVSDAGRILGLVDSERKQASRRRISILCIDAAPNSQLASEIADRGGGVARFLTSQPSEEDITTALDEVLADWAAPVLVGLRLEVNRLGLETAGRDLIEAASPGWSAADLGDLPSGRPVWVCGRVPLVDGKTPSFRLSTAAGPVTGETAARAEDAGKGLLSLFGARRVTGLEYLMNSGRQGDDLAGGLKRLGYDPAAVLAAVAPKVYAENARKAGADALKPLLVKEALRYGLACAETAFVAVRKEKGKPVAGTVAVANALPAGWSDDFASRTAMASPSPFVMRAAVGPVPTAPGVGALFKRAGRGMLANVSLQMASVGGQPEAEPEIAPVAPMVVFRGHAVTIGGSLVLADSARPADAALNATVGTISELRLTFTGPGGAPKAADLDRGLSLLLFVDDLSSPRAKVRLADLVRQGGRRPLNVMRLAGQTLRLILVDENGVWASSGPDIEVSLAW